MKIRIWSPPITTITIIIIIKKKKRKLKTRKNKVDKTFFS